MRTVLITTGLFLSAIRGLAAADTQSTHPYRSEYRRKTFGVRSLAPVAGRAGVNQLRNSPHEWGQGASGFAKRAGSAFGIHVIKNSIEYPIAAIRHEDLHYYRSTTPGFWPRVRHALASTVVTRKTTTGQKTVASGRISGALGSGLIASTWRPAGFSAAGGVASGGITLGGAAAVNVAREFWPRRHKTG
jgi:hypothetical protein